MSLGYEINGYGIDLNKFIRHRGLLAKWFTVPDHIAIMTKNARHSNDLLKEIKKGPPGVEQIIQTEVDERRINIVMLAGSLAVGPWWKVELIKLLLDPRPEETGRRTACMDHMVFRIADLSQFEGHLESIVGIVPDVQQKSDHQTLSVRFAKEDREVRFTNTGLADVAEERLTSGNAEIIYTRPTQNRS